MSKFSSEFAGSSESDPLLRGLAWQSEQIDSSANRGVAASDDDDVAGLANSGGLSEQQLLAVSRFDNHCRRLGELIRSLPARPVGAEFTRSVMQQVRQMPLKPVELTSEARLVVNNRAAEDITVPDLSRYHGVSQRSSSRGITSSIALAVTAVVMLMIGRPFNNQSAVDRNLAVSESADESPELVRLKLLKPAAEPPGSVETLAANFGFVDDNSKVFSDVDIKTARTSVLSEGPDWQIVVVHVDSSDRAAVMQMVAKAANDLNMDIRTMPDAIQQQSNSIGVLLTSAAVKNQSFLDSVTQAPQVSSSEWNPLAIGQMDRQELINAVRESMLHPTKSELHFGKIYLAMPRSGSQVGTALAATDTARSEIQTDKPLSGHTGLAHGSQSHPPGLGTAELLADSASDGLLLHQKVDSQDRNAAAWKTAADELIVADRQIKGEAVTHSDESSQFATHRSSKQPSLAHASGSAPVLVVFEFSNRRQTTSPNL